LNQVSTKLQSLMATESFYEEVVRAIHRLLGYTAIHIWSVESDERVLLRAQAGAYDPHFKTGSTVLEAKTGIIGHVIQTHKSYVANDVSKDPYFTNLSLPVDSKSELSIPVLRDDKVMAVLNVESNQVGAFETDDVMTLEAIASQIAVALVNRNLYSEVKDFNTKLQGKVEEKTLELRNANLKIMQQQRLLQKENKALKTLVQNDRKSMDIVGKSPAILSILTMADKIAPTTATVLIQGESGTGKELIARQLHFKSDRADKPYVTLNCGTLQEALLESELFGHERGSFTGAVAQKAGLCETADGGTLFLDEIGEMSLPIQSKLLRFLQEGEFYRIGGKRPIKVDVRVISATNRDLEQEVKAGRFREDLYYRLNTITLRMPPLRKRKEDIAILVDYFLKTTRFGGSVQQIRRIDPRVYEVFSNYDWPGNIRELQNTIERLKILAENNEIRLEDIPFNIRMPRTKAESPEFSLNMPLDEVEKNHILRTLAYNQGNKTKTAQSLGITIKTLYNKLHRYGLIRAQAGVLAEQDGSSIA
ncbi:MAG TPA: sigma-54-dependent Fis family transcriptional regulator, partial [Bdellovibrionota bacterium]|nr:sigma-54-dependent Fis family transcriptional regulator [Bdellovibrionota bacterium]